METIENRFGKTVAIRPEGPSDFDEALSKARRLFSSVGQKENLLISERAWPHATFSNQQIHPMNGKTNSRDPIESLAKTIIESDNTGLILADEVRTPLSEKQLEAISEDLPRKEDCEAYFQDRLKENLADALRASEIDAEQAKVLETILTSEIPLMGMMQAGVTSRLKAEQETADAYAEVLQEAGINLQPSIQRGL